MTQRPVNPWIAFAAGAVAVLVLALMVVAWQSRRSAQDLARTAVAATKALPDIAPPRLPDAPRLPDGPLPRPK